MDDASILDRTPPKPDRRIIYGSGPNRFGELRLPAGPGPFPVAVTVHGGFWRSRQNLRYFGHLNAALAERGIATWNIEYNRVGHAEGGWPATFADAAAAIDFLRVLSVDYPLDNRRALAVGHSAGGHLALWLSMRHRISPDSPLFTPDPLPLTGAVSIAGVSDLERGWTGKLGTGAVEGLMGATPSAAPERYAAASPALLLPARVRQVLVHGRLDEAVPAAMSEAYVALARSLGDPAELQLIDEAGHFEPIDPDTEAGLATLRWVEKMSGGPASAGAGTPGLPAK